MAVLSPMVISKIVFELPSQNAFITKQPCLCYGLLWLVFQRVGLVPWCSG